MSKTAFLTRHGMTDLRELPAHEFTAENLGDTLAKTNRFTGRTPQPWSVAAHSVLVSRLCASPEAKAAGLLHDAYEAFIGDVITPAVEFIASQNEPIGGNIIRSCVAQAKASLDRQIGFHWNVAFLYNNNEVAHADRIALLAEMTTFFSAPIAVSEDDFEDIERALDILRGLPTNGDWLQAYTLWVSEVNHLAQLGHLTLPQTDNQNSAPVAEAV